MKDFRYDQAQGIRLEQDYMASGNPETPLLVRAGEQQFRTNMRSRIRKPGQLHYLLPHSIAPEEPSSMIFYNCAHHSNRTRIVPEKQGILLPAAPAARLENSRFNQNNALP